MAGVNLEKIFKKRSKLLLRFFFKTHYLNVIFFAILFVGAGLAAFFTRGNENLLLHYILGGVAILLFLFLLLSILRLFNGNLKREEVDAIYAHDRQIAYDGLFKNLVIENSKSKYQAEPFEIVCPELYPRRNKILYRYFKEDGKVYYTHVGYSWLFFGEKSLYYYHSTVNHVHGYVGYDVSCEFDYKDIVSISTVTDHKNNVETFVLTITLVNGESLDIALRTRPNKIYTSTHALNEKEAAVVATIRNVIRNSK